MKILFLDLASHDALIACCDDQSTVASESVAARIGDHEVLPMIEKALHSAGWSFEDLDQIACIVGPGGFTSLRVAVTFANVLADQLGIGLAGIHLADVYQARIETESGKRKVENVYWMHSTKKDQLFIKGGKWEEATLITVDDLVTLNSSFDLELRTERQLSTLLWMGELIPEHQAIITADPINLQPVTDVLPQLLAAQTYTKDILTPWYGRGW